MIVRLLEITADAAASASSFIRDRRHSAVCEPHPSFKPLDIDARRTHSCQTSPGHVVVLDHAVKILDGARPPSTEQVSTGYPIVLGSNAKLEAQEISMTFADPLVIECADKAEVKLSMSFFRPHRSMSI